MNTWSLVTYRTEDRPGDRLGALLPDGTVVAVPVEVAAAGLMALLPRWESAAERLRTWDPSGGARVAGARLLAPLRYPRKIFGACGNYRSHLDQFKSAELPGRWTGYFHFTPPTTTVVGTGADIVINADPDEQVDWEGELAIVIGIPGRSVAVEDAFRHIAGYVIANDVSARGRFHRSDEGPRPFQYDWLASKGQDTFNPLGPGMTPAWMIGDPNSLNVRLSVNGMIKQDYNTSAMTLDVRELVAAASAIATLEPGDVIMAGSGPGNAWHKDAFLRPGDHVTVEIEGLGTLENSVRAR